MENENNFGRFIFIANQWLHLAPGVEIGDAGTCGNIYRKRYQYALVVYYDLTEFLTNIQNEMVDEIIRSVSAEAINEVQEEEDNAAAFPAPIIPDVDEPENGCNVLVLYIFANFEII